MRIQQDLQKLATFPGSKRCFAHRLKEIRAGFHLICQNTHCEFALRDRYEANHRRITLGDDNFLTLQSGINQLGELAFGFMNRELHNLGM